MLNPQKIKALGVNGQILTKAILHATYLERYKTHEVTKILKDLDKKVLPNLMGQLQIRMQRIKERGFDAGPATTKRLQEVIGAVDAEIKQGLQFAHKTLQKDLESFAISEGKFMEAVAKESTPFKLDLRTPSPAMMRSVVTAKPMQGRFLKDWFGGLATGTRNKLSEQLNMGFYQGESIAQMTSRWRKVIDGSRRNVETLVRTAVNHTSNHARGVLAAENQDVVKGEQWVATLDSRTTVICASLDGRVFKVNEGQRPPAHMNCRSTIIPVLKSWKELGINLKEAPVGTRASMNGQVAAKVTYPQWLKDQPVKIQNEVLGVRKAQLWRSGKIKFDKFVDTKNRPLTLRQLEQLEGRTPSPKTVVPAKPAPYAGMSTKQSDVKYWKSLSAADKEFLKEWAEMQGTGGATGELETWQAVRKLELTAPTDPKVVYFNSLLDRAPKYKGTTFRVGSEWAEDPFKGITRKKVGDTVSLQTSASTTSSKKVSNSFLESLLDSDRPYRLVVKSKSGADTRMALKQLAQWDEKEVILRKTSKYKVTKTRPIKVEGFEVIEIVLEEY